MSEEFRNVPDDIQVACLDSRWPQNEEDFSHTSVGNLLVSANRDSGQMVRIASKVGTDGTYDSLV